MVCLQGNRTWCFMYVRILCKIDSLVTQQHASIETNDLTSAYKAEGV